jgi:hypothetical protein
VKWEPKLPAAAQESSPIRKGSKQRSWEKELPLTISVGTLCCGSCGPGLWGGGDDKRAMRSEEKRMGRVVSLYALKGRLSLRLVLMHILLKAVEARRAARDIH